MNIPFLRLQRAIHKAFGLTMPYKVGRFDVQLTPDHLLPIHQAQNDRYDRFLPHLARALAEGDVVVDVGANCGDSLAAMLSEQPNAQYLGVEADDGFFRLLEKNIQQFRTLEPTLKVQVVKAFVGMAGKTGAISGKGGTATMMADGSHHSIELSRLVDEAGILPTSGRSDNALLIKSDVDGFDFDVLRSAGHLLQRAQTILFFEAHCINNSHREGFVNFYDELQSLGYHHYWVFDNVGRYMFKTDNIRVMQDLANYSYAQNQPGVRTTFRYIDILCSKDDKLEFCERVVKSYLAI